MFEQLWPDASKKVVIGMGVQGKVHSNEVTNWCFDPVPY